MKVKKFINGNLLENCYVLYDNLKALIIDPGNIIEQLNSFIDNNNLKVLGILITHYHFDHTGGLNYYKNLYDVKIIDYANKENKVKIENFEFNILKCFGHTKDSVSFYFEKEKIMFTGDFLFKETIGNYSEENENLMLESLKNIKGYDKDIIIYPGHDESSSLENEFKNNPYLRGK